MTGRERPARALLALHLAALTAFAVAQPLFDLLARSPEFFVAHRAGRADIALLSLLLLAGIPAAVMVVVLLVDRVDRRAGTLAGAAAIAALGGAFVLLALKRTAGPQAAVAIPAAIAGGTAIAIAYVRFAPVRSFVTLLAIGSIVFPIAFARQPTIAALLESPASARAPVVPAAKPATVVFVVFDQFPLASLVDPSGAIERSAYPAFAALAERSTWYRNATTVNPVTGWSVPAILTGRRPRPEDLPVATSHPDSLFTLLAPTHALHVIEPITDMCPDDLCPPPREPLGARARAMLADLSIVFLHAVLPADLAGRLPSVTQDWKNFAAALNWQQRWAAREDERRHAVWDDFLAGITRGERPTLHYAHVLLPHDPFVYLPSGARYTDEQMAPGLSASYRWSGDPWLVAQGYQRHLLQASFVDTLVGRLLARLESQQLLDQALLVIASDHGAGFRPGGPLRNVDPQQFAAIMNVPLLIKAPYQAAGAIDDRNVETIDILPTLAEILGARVPWAIDGRPASAEPRELKEFSYERVKVTRRFDPRALLDGVRAIAATKYELFGEPTGPFRLIRAAPYAGLVGRPPDDFPAAPPGPGTRATIERSHSYAQVDPESGFVPAKVDGTLEWHASEEPPAALAVAVNGTIRATTLVRPAGRGNGHWSAMVLPSSLHAGSNRIDVYAVSGPPHAPRLARAGSTRN